MALKNSLFNVDKLIELRPTRGYPIMDTLSFLVYSIEYYLLIKYCYRLVQRRFDLGNFLTSFIELILFLLIAKTNCLKCSPSPLYIVHCPKQKCPYLDNSFKNISFNIFGFAFPFVCFMACPTKKPKARSFPAL